MGKLEFGMALAFAIVAASLTSTAEAQLETFESPVTDMKSDYGADVGVLGPPTSSTGGPERHRLQGVELPNGHRLLLGRNLSELHEIRELIGRAAGRIIALTLLLASVS